MSALALITATVEPGSRGPVLESYVKALPDVKSKVLLGEYATFELADSVVLSVDLEPDQLHMTLSIKGYPVYGNSKILSASGFRQAVQELVKKVEASTNMPIAGRLAKARAALREFR